MYSVSAHPMIFTFAFQAGTSRGVLKEKTSWFIRLQLGDVIGWGECSPIAGLSPEPLAIMEEKINTVLNEWRKAPEQIMNASSEWTEQLYRWPSLRFALETAWLDFSHGGKHQLFKNDFYKGKKAIPINGLVWMNTVEHMQAQIEEKLAQGYRCIKLKIGHHAFESEYALLKALRQRFSADRLTLRVDANGAYTEANVHQVLEDLAALQVHSIEQPIAPGNIKLLADLCRNSPVPVALDEELIVHAEKEEKITLLQEVSPAYLVLKPSLHGGLQGCREWIELAEERQIKWWMTSYLESAIGLNAIAQFTSEYPVTLFQGLGTGQIYTRTIGSPLEVVDGALTYNTKKTWENP